LQPTERLADTKSVMGLHQIPNSLIKERLSKFNNGTIKDNRMSYGCVNFQLKDIENLKTIVKPGSKVYILPEESDNSLKLKKAAGDKYIFVQSKYTKTA